MYDSIPPSKNHYLPINLLLKYTYLFSQLHKKSESGLILLIAYWTINISCYAMMGISYMETYFVYFI